jgi:hypothetical protein
MTVEYIHEDTYLGEWRWDYVDLIMKEQFEIVGVPIAQWQERYEEIDARFDYLYIRNPFAGVVDAVRMDLTTHNLTIE